ncbi:MAG: cupin domain-containing protein [Gammaproteobacteria bacterium]|jgi:quercetin dioxygenase-like cupin family protein|nr:cupin domain-containing protein [Gammaproteobacteria bacterium]
MSTKRPSAVASQQIDNERVIVTRWRFAPGAETGWHRHGYDYVVIPGMDGQLLLQSDEGENIAELRAGESYFRKAGVEHNVINANDYEFFFIEVELR